MGRDRRSCSRYKVVELQSVHGYVILDEYVHFCNIRPPSAFVCTIKTCAFGYKCVSVNMSESLSMCACMSVCVCDPQGSMDDCGCEPMKG